MCDPYACDAAACRTTCTAQRDCVAPFTCIGGSCAQKAAGVACGAGGECSVGLLRAGRLLRLRRAAAPASRARWPARSGPAPTSRRDRSAEPVRRSRRRELQHRRHVQRQRRLPPVRRGGAVRGGDVHRVDVHARADLQRYRHLPDRHLVQLRALRLRHRRLPDHLHDHRRLRVAQRRSGTGSCGLKSARRRRAPATPECNSGICDQGICCGGACTRHLPLVRHRRDAGRPAPTSRAAQIR